MVSLLENSNRIKKMQIIVFIIEVTTRKNGTVSFFCGSVLKEGGSVVLADSCFAHVW